MGDGALTGTILPYPMVSGPPDDGRLLFELRRMDDGRPAMCRDKRLMRCSGSRRYAENVAHATVLAVVDTRAAGRIYNVAESEALTTAANAHCH